MVCVHSDILPRINSWGSSAPTSRRRDRICSYSIGEHCYLGFVRTTLVLIFFLTQSKGFSTIVERQQNTEGVFRSAFWGFPSTLVREILLVHSGFLEHRIRCQESLTRQGILWYNSAFLVIPTIYSYFSMYLQMFSFALQYIIRLKNRKCYYNFRNIYCSIHPTNKFVGFLSRNCKFNEKVQRVYSHV